MSHNFYRHFQHRNAKRSSGGLAIYYKDSIKQGITIERSHCDTIVWLKLDKIFFNFENDVYLCGIYLWGEDSPAYNISPVDLFDLLQNDVYEFENVGSLYLIGDWNSRVGVKNDFILFDKFNIEIDDIDYIPDNPIPRSSLDKTCNSFGVKLLDLCKCTGLRIVNGRLYNDNLGSYTYASTQGASVIDYLLTKECCFSTIDNFTIQSFNEWSDHSPISFTLRCKLFNKESTESVGTRYKWNSDCKNDFRSSIISKLPIFNSLTNSINNSDRTSINNLITDFTSIIRDVADPIFSSQVSFSKKSAFNNSISQDKEWFDVDCVRAKNAYIESLHVYNNSKSSSSREQFCRRKKEYKNIVWKKRKTHKAKKILEIESLRFSKPKEFWKYFKRKQKNNNEITMSDFYKYFSELSGDILQNKNEKSEEFSTQHNFNDLNCSYGELDRMITVSEILEAVKNLKRDKSAGSDFLLNEYFIESIDILSSHICDIFNAILDSGFFPEKWTEGVIVPLHKKGDKNDANNYRGITLVSCLSKIFTSVLNKRIVTFCNDNNVISDAQFGFQKGKSTVDIIIILSSLVQKYLNENKRLYCVFVDFKKAFDCVYRNALWLKLYKQGIQGKLLRIIRDMYQKVKSCVKSCNTYSEFFEYSVGLRQGEVISPIMFSLFIEDIELMLQDKFNSGLQINDMLLILLLFADDMVILGNTPEDLQNSLDLLLTYCNEWSLDVNILKTKVMVFRKRGNLLQNESFTYNNSKLDIVNDFNYLGTVFNYTGSFGLNIQQLVKCIDD